MIKWIFNKSDYYAHVLTVKGYPILAIIPALPAIFLVALTFIGLIPHRWIWDVDDEGK